MTSRAPRPGGSGIYSVTWQVRLRVRVSVRVRVRVTVRVRVRDIQRQLVGVAMASIAIDVS